MPLSKKSIALDVVASVTLLIIVTILYSFPTNGVHKMFDFLSININTQTDTFCGNKDGFSEREDHNFKSQSRLVEDTIK